ncbi:site-specific integrase, partial [Acinetobacter baumannii]
HSTTEMLFRVYSRYIPNVTRRDGSAFEAMLERLNTEKLVHEQ